jgi:hypothetical protein
MTMSFSIKQTLLASVLALNFVGCKAIDDLKKAADKPTPQEKPAAPTSTLFAAEVLSLKSVRLLGEINVAPTDWQKDEITQRTFICVNGDVKDGSQNLWAQVYVPELKAWKSLQIAMTHKDLAWNLQDKAYVGQGSFSWVAELKVKEEEITDWVLDLEEMLNRPLEKDTYSTRKVVRYLQNTNEGYGLAVQIRAARADSAKDPLVEAICPSKKD